MLSIAPVVGSPSTVLADAIKMFDGADMKGAEILAERDEKHSPWNTEFMLMDNSRV